MPVRHFLRRDYLHIFFYIKFLLFGSRWTLIFKSWVGRRGLTRSLWLLIRELFLHKKIARDAGAFLKNVSFLEFDFLESHIFLENLPFSSIVDLG